MHCIDVVYCYKCSSVAVCLFVGHTKTAKPIQMPFVGLAHVSPRNLVLDGDQDQTNEFAVARGYNTAMQPFVTIV